MAGSTIRSYSPATGSTETTAGVLVPANSCAARLAHRRWNRRRRQRRLDAQRDSRQRRICVKQGAQFGGGVGALIFSSDRQEAVRNLTPTLTPSFNTLVAHTHQHTHRHNSAAVTLVVQGEACHSMVDATRCLRSPWAPLVTPPGAPHSHHNADDGIPVSRRRLDLFHRPGRTPRSST